eukprot:350990-Amphidinium_carterae.2
MATTALTGHSSHDGDWAWTGAVRIDTKGAYTFSLNSDDGSTLTVDDLEVVNNDGLHGMLTKFGTVELDKGWHGGLVCLPSRLARQRHGTHA